MSNLETTKNTSHLSISTDTARGATIRTAYVEREVKAYAIFENEVRTISMWNTLANVFFAVGAALLSFAIGIWTNAMFAEKLTPEGIVLSHVIAPILSLATAVFWALAVWSIFSRSRVWSAIETESKQPTTD